MKNKKNVIIAVMIAVALLMATGYAYFATQLNINATGNITSNWNVYFESISNGTIVGNASNVVTPSVSGTSANMNVNLNIPGDSITYNIVLKNGGTVPAIIEDIDAVATGSGAIIYSISGLNIGDKLASGASKTITVKIEYDPKTTGQPSETSKQLTVTIDAAQDIGQTITNETPSISQPLLLSNQILKNNTAQVDTNIDFSQPSSDTNGKGLYYTSTNTENNLTTYYFRGNVENNYVQLGKTKVGSCVYNGQPVYYRPNESPELVVSQSRCQNASLYICDTSNLTNSDFYGKYVLADPGECQYAIGGTPTTNQPVWQSDEANLMWRIVRINEDKSIRLIMDQIDDYSEYDVNMNPYMYGTEDNPNANSSTIKEYLDNWYNSNFSGYSGLLADPGFCVDRRKGNSSEYLTYTRVLANKSPQFACHDEKDLFTTQLSNKGNKALTNPVGLLTADEILYGGTYLNIDINGKTYDTWLSISPVTFSTIAVMKSTGLGEGSIDQMSWGVRPVINFKADVEAFLNGTGEPGTSTNPYVIKTN